MKRDMDLVRLILQQMEEKADGSGRVRLDLPGHADGEVAYHLQLLKEAELIEATAVRSSESGLQFIPIRLTWEGHEFLDAIKNETVWNKVKATVKEKGGAMPFEILKALALQFAKSYFGVG